MECGTSSAASGNRRDLRNVTNNIELTMECGTSSAGRARPCQGRGHEFEPRVPLQSFSSNLPLLTYNFD